MDCHSDVIENCRQVMSDLLCDCIVKLFGWVQNPVCVQVLSAVQPLGIGSWRAEIGSFAKQLGLELVEIIPKYVIMGYLKPESVVHLCPVPNGPHELKVRTAFLTR